MAKKTQWFEATRIGIPLQDGSWALGFVIEDRAFGRPNTSVVQLFGLAYSSIDALAAASLSRNSLRTLSILLVAGEPSHWAIIGMQPVESLALPSMRARYLALFEGKLAEHAYSAQEIERLLSEQLCSAVGSAIRPAVSIPVDWCSYG